MRPWTDLYTITPYLNCSNGEAVPQQLSSSLRIQKRRTPSPPWKCCCPGMLQEQEKMLWKSKNSIEKQCASNQFTRTIAPLALLPERRHGDILHILQIDSNFLKSLFMTGCGHYVLKSIKKLTLKKKTPFKLN